MKNNIGLLLIFMVIALNSVKGQEENIEIYKDKAATFKRVQNVGLALTGIGSGSFLAGSILFATIPKSYWDSNSNYNYTYPNQAEYDKQAVQGIVFFSLGIVMITGGLTMSHVAKRKAISYRKQLDNLSLGIISVPGGQGLSLTYRF